MWVDSKPIDENPYKKSKAKDIWDREKVHGRGGSTMKTEAESGILQPQVKKCQWLPEGEEAKNRLSTKTYKGSITLSTPWFWTSDL